MTYEESKKLTPEEKTDIVVRAKSGDKNAKELLWVSVRGMVAEWARKQIAAVGKRVIDECGDLVNDAYVYFEQAIADYNPKDKSGASFATFFFNKLRFRRYHTLHWVAGVGDGQRTLMLEADDLLAQIKSEMKKGDSLDAAIQTVAKNNRERNPLVTVPALYGLVDCKWSVMSLDAPIVKEGEDEGTCLLDTIAADDAPIEDVASDADARVRLWSIIDRHGISTSAYMHRYFEDNKTFRDIAKESGDYNFNRGKAVTFQAVQLKVGREVTQLRHNKEIQEIGRAYGYA